MTKDKRVEIRLSSDDKKLAQSLSFMILGKNNTSKLFIKLLRSAENKTPIILDDQLVDFRKAVGQLSGIARNLNQITRRVNSEDVITKDMLSISYLTSLKDYVTGVNNELKKLIKDNS